MNRVVAIPPTLGLAAIAVWCNDRREEELMHWMEYMQIYYEGVSGRDVEHYLRASFLTSSLKSCVPSLTPAEVWTGCVRQYGARYR